MAVLSHIPIWVFPLFILLLVVGLRARSPRLVPLWVIYALPLLGALSLRAVAGLQAQAWIWLVFAVFYGFGVALGFRLQVRWLRGVVSARASMAGEPLTLILMMVVFAINFAAGFTKAVAADVASGPVFVVGFTVIAALAGGVFAGRALQVWRLARAQ